MELKECFLIFLGFRKKVIDANAVVVLLSTAMADSENKACLTNNVQCGLHAAAETQEQP